MVNITEEAESTMAFAGRRNMPDINRPMVAETKIVQDNIDSGKNISIKYDSDKPDLSLLPTKALEEVARVLEHGADKYGRDNWRVSGFKYSRLIAATLRHVFSFIRGEDRDPESGLNHLGHAICCLLFLLTQFMNRQEDLDDRYKKS